MLEGIDETPLSLMSTVPCYDREPFRRNVFQNRTSCLKGVSRERATRRTGRLLDGPQTFRLHGGTADDAIPEGATSDSSH